MQAIAPLLIVHSYQQLAPLHLFVIACSLNKAAGLCTVTLCLMLLVDFGIFSIRGIMVLAKPTVELQHLAAGILGEWHMILVLAAYPVVTVTIRPILLACTCSYYVQICVTFFWLYIADDVIKSRGPFKHSLLIQPITSDINDSHRRLTQIHGFW